MLTDQEDSGKYGQIISGLLQDKIEDRLDKKEQVILLQNRRGFSPVIRCGDCGEVTMCVQCQIALTYHRHDEKLICHSCGYTENEKRTNCQGCASNNLKYFGTGTQKVESLIKETFPKARVCRLDADTSKVQSNLTNILKMFSAGKIDILLGTQMIAKGLDFPNATLVGIINADTGLYLPDFRAGEKVFQLIYQAAGRSGRGEIPGEVVVQTYNSDNDVIKLATQLELEKYYENLLNERKSLDYPPYSWMVRLEFRGTNKKKIESEIDWNLTALEISNKVRAFYPFPGTFTNGPNGLIKIITTQSNNDVHDQPPGTILNIGKKIFVACGNNTTLEILEVQKPGKNIISALAYLNGIKLSVGDKFGI